MTTHSPRENPGPGGPHRELPQNEPVYRDPREVPERRRRRSWIVETVLLLCGLGTLVWFLGSGDKGTPDTSSSTEAAASSVTGTSHPDEPEPSGVADAGDLPAQAHQVLQAHCVKCHGTKLVVEGFHIGRYATLLDAAHEYVVPGDLEASRLWQRISVEHDMPPEGNEPLPNESIAVLQRWIEAGAAPFPETEL